MSYIPFRIWLLLTLFVFISCLQREANAGVSSVQSEKHIGSEPDRLKDYDAAFGRCDAYVSNSGKDSNDGSLQNPYKTPAHAISHHKSGGVICLSEGVYPEISVVDVKTTKENPLVIRKAPQSDKDVLVTPSDYDYKTGVQVLRSNHVYVMGLHVSGFQKGISFDSVVGGGIIDNKVSKIGLDGLHVGQNFNYVTQSFADYPSSHVIVLNNHVYGTGYQDFRRTGKRHKYGEGIYIGTGAKFGDGTHDILVQNNEINDTSAEAIEVKPGTYDVQVLGNRISNVSLSFKGAITVSIGSGNDDTNGNYSILGNSIENVTTRGDAISGIAVGHGNTLIQGNRVRHVEGGMGIRIYKSFRNTEFRKVLIQDNVIESAGSGLGIAINDLDHGHPGLEGNVELRSGKHK